MDQLALVVHLSGVGRLNTLFVHGSENKGQLLEWIYGQKAPPIISKIIAGTPDFPFSNSMSERTHSIYKSEFMGGQFSTDKSQHLADLDRFFIITTQLVSQLNYTDTVLWR